MPAWGELSRLCPINSSMDGIEWTYRDDDLVGIGIDITVMGKQPSIQPLLQAVERGDDWLAMAPHYNGRPPREGRACPIASATSKDDLHLSYRLRSNERDYTERALRLEGASPPLDRPSIFRALLAGRRDIGR